ncbi:MAG: hypothetical protein ACK4Z8_16435, partial [Novosphingobium sp.]
CAGFVAAVVDHEDDVGNDAPSIGKSGLCGRIGEQVDSGRTTCLPTMADEHGERIPRPQSSVQAAGSSAKAGCTASRAKRWVRRLPTFWSQTFSN